MKKLTKKQGEEKAKMNDHVNEATAAFRGVVDAYNVQMDSEYEKVKAAIAAFNDEKERQWAFVKASAEALDGVLIEARDFADSVHSDIESSYGAKSEKWQDSDTGQAVDQWRTAWEDAREKFNVTVVDELTEPAHLDAEQLEYENIGADGSYEIDEIESALSNLGDEAEG